MSVALPFTICVATLLAGFFVSRWFRVGVIALMTLCLIIVVIVTGLANDRPAWECALFAIGLSFILQFGYLGGGIFLDSLANRGHEPRASLVGPHLID